MQWYENVEEKARSEGTILESGNLLGRWEYLLCGHTTITAKLFYNRRLSIGTPAPHINS